MHAPILLSKDLVVLDFETTGTSPATDRIVQYSFIKITANGETIKKKGLLNPKCPIPAEATAVHGVTDEMVAEAPTFKQFSKGMLDFIDGCILGGYNIKKFDLPLLYEEFNRVAIDWDPMSHEIYDSFEILTANESRTLAWAKMFYCGDTLEGAHDAENDVVATIDILAAQIKKYNLTEAPKSKTLDLDGVIQLDSEGEYIYGIGKEKKGTRVKDDPDFGFADWILRNDFSSFTKKVVRKIKNELSNN